MRLKYPVTVGAIECMSFSGLMLTPCMRLMRKANFLLFFHRIDRLSSSSDISENTHSSRQDDPSNDETLAVKHFFGSRYR